MLSNKLQNINRPEQLRPFQFDTFAISFLRILTKNVEQIRLYLLCLDGQTFLPSWLIPQEEHMALIFVSSIVSSASARIP